MYCSVLNILYISQTAENLALMQSTFYYLNNIFILSIPKSIPIKPIIVLDDYLVLKSKSNKCYCFL